MDNTVILKMVVKSNLLVQRLRKLTKCLICTTDLLAKDKQEKAEGKRVVLEFQ